MWTDEANVKKMELQHNNNKSTEHFFMCQAGTPLRILYILIHLFIAIVYSRFCHFPLTDEGTVAQRNETNWK